MDEIRRTRFREWFEKTHSIKPYSGKDINAEYLKKLEEIVIMQTDVAVKIKKAIEALRKDL